MSEACVNKRLEAERHAEEDAARLAAEEAARLAEEEEAAKKAEEEEAEAHLAALEEELKQKYEAELEA